MKNYYLLIMSVLLFACSSTENALIGNYVFITKSKGTADIKTWTLSGTETGISAADAVCQSEAAQAGLKGTFKAWLSDDTEDAKDRLGDNTTGWLRTDGHPFALNLEYLLDSPEASQKEKDSHKGPLVPNRFHADGTLSAPTEVFTNTDPKGLKYISHLGVTEDCDGWDTSVDSAYEGIGGYSESASVNWTDNGGAINLNCSDEAALYCFQVDEGVYDAIDSSAYELQGKLAFLTSIKGAGDFAGGNWAPYSGGMGGLDGADNICQSLVEAEGLPNSTKFKAYISTTVPSIINAVDRFTYDGPWVLINGVKFAENKADFADGTVFTNLDVTEKGEKIHDNFYLDYNFVWSGSDSTSNAQISGSGTGGEFLDNLNCQGWSSDDSLDIARVGKFSKADLEWIAHTIDGNDFYSCNNQYRIYCLEDE